MNNWKGGYVQPEYVEAMLTAKADADLPRANPSRYRTAWKLKDRVLKPAVFCQYPEGVRFGEEEDDIACLVIGIAARNNEHIQSLPA